MLSSSTAADAGKSLALLIPGLFGPRAVPLQDDAAQGHALAALEILLARAERLTPPPPAPLEATIFSLFQIEAPPGDLPVAAVTRVHDLGVIDNEWWIRADPVHLEAARDGLILSAGAALDITPHEAERLAAEIMESYAADGWRLKAPHPQRWYLKPPRAPDLRTTPLSEVTGRDIRSALPHGADGKLWHTRLNEIQILLHTARVNEEREQLGKRPINSLWFWGGGRLPPLKPCPWAQLWSEEPVSRALARLAGIPARAVPTGLDEWFSQALGGAQLVVLDQVREAVLHEDIPAWREGLERLERRWFAPALAALKSGGLASLTLYSDCGQGMQLTRRRLRHWWRRRRALASYAPAGLP